MEVRLKKGSPFRVALLGPGGTGKTVVLRALVEFFESDWGIDTVILASPVGSAAANIGGRTRHSLFGISVKRAGEFIKLTLKKKRALIKFLKGKMALFIDEISLCSPILLAELDFVLRQIPASWTSDDGGVKSKTLNVFDDLPLEVEKLRDKAVPKGPKNLWQLFELKELRRNYRTTDNNEARILEAVLIVLTQKVLK